MFVCSVPIFVLIFVFVSSAILPAPFPYPLFNLFIWFYYFRFVFFFCFCFCYYFFASISIRWFFMWDVGCGTVCVPNMYNNEYGWMVLHMPKIYRYPRTSITIKLVQHSTFITEDVPNIGEISSTQDAFFFFRISYRARTKCSITKCWNVWRDNSKIVKSVPHFEWAHIQSTDEKKNFLKMRSTNKNGILSVGNWKDLWIFGSFFLLLFSFLVLHLFPRCSYFNLFKAFNIQHLHFYIDTEAKIANDMNDDDKRFEI